MSMQFNLKSQYKPTGDQPRAIAEISARVQDGVPQQTLIGVTGSGKSVTKATSVIIKQGEKITLEEIGSFIDKLFLSFPNKIRNVADSEIIFTDDLPLSQVETYSFDPNTNTPSWKSIKQFVRHKSAAAALSNVITQCGRSVTVTIDHNFFVLRKGALHLLATAEIQKGDYLPIPLNLPKPESHLETISSYEYLPSERKLFISLPQFKTCWDMEKDSIRSLLTPAKVHNILHAEERVSLASYKELVLQIPQISQNATVGVRGKDYQLPLTLPLASDVLRLFGYYIAEGHAEKSYFILSSGDTEIISDFTATLSQFGIHWRKCPRTYDYQICSAFWSDLLSSLHGKNSKTKRLPHFWPQLSDVQLGNLLSAYFSADGGIDGDQITCTTASRELASDIGYALLRFGIVARIRKRTIKIPNKDTYGAYWVVVISGQRFLEFFREKINFTLSRKQKLLAALVNKPYNTNTDIIPIDDAWIKDMRARLSLYQRDVAKSCGVKRSHVSLVEHGLRKPSRRLFEKMLLTFKNAAENNHDRTIINEIEEKKQLLHVYWSPIKDIQPADPEQYVYDFAVEENETFLAGTGGIFVHNTFSMANVIQNAQKPTLVISHNKTLAAQLYQEFKEFFPENAVHYFVSYYDYYQPEAYLPQTDTYIEKDAAINDFIDRLRHAATQAILTRPDTIIVASVSCIYGIGDPAAYGAMALTIRKGQAVKQNEFLRALAALQYEREDTAQKAGTFSVKGDVIEITSPTGMETMRVEFFGNEIERINNGIQEKVTLFPAKHFVTPNDKLQIAMTHIERELDEHLRTLKKRGKILEAERLRQRTRFDMEMLKNTGYCSGIENYSRHIAFRAPGTPPSTLLNYFPDNFLVFIDESHMTVPQIRGMYHGDRARKEILIEHGFRLPSALDNRPLTFEEFEERTPQTVYVSATPSAYEISQGPSSEQLIRPTGLLDPDIEIRPAKNQIRDAAGEIQKRAAAGERTLVTTITKRLAEDIADYLQEQGVRTAYIHADVKTLQRTELLQKLRKGEFDCLVGINLLREGLDIPEVSLVAILDADKEGFLRNTITLIQTMGRAARHPHGHVILYADRVTTSIREAMAITQRRRQTQEEYNKKHGITPQAIIKEIRAWFAEEKKESKLEEKINAAKKEKRSITELKKELEAEMLEAAANLDFERAAKLRDALKKAEL